MVLAEIIRERIAAEGPISFHDFMEMALYHPQLGYYNSEQNKIGADGDFYTSANLSASFGAMIGRQIEEMWQILGRKPFTIVEYGAGTGLLCHDIMLYLKDNSDLYDCLRYCIIEKSTQMQEIEKKHLHEKVSWYDSIKDIPHISGCVLSNELVDNFAIHQVVMQDILKEVYVDYRDGFKEVLVPAKKELVDYFKSLLIQLPNGFRTEINLELKEWIIEVSQYLKNGYVITIDYGGCSSDLYAIHRSSGTLLCYNKHQKNDNPFQLIGSQDITSHVNFTALTNWGNENGLETCGITNQTHFLTAMGIKEYHNEIINNHENNSQAKIHESYINYSLLMSMGLKFKVLIQRKGTVQKLLKGLNL
jgi:SAM-dependent MidA family methyltransferase